MAVNRKNIAWLLAGFLGYAAVLILVYAARNRAFWLDEAFVYDSLLSKSPWEILFGGVLLHGQKFPKLYLALIDLFAAAAPAGTFWPRVLPLLFGLAGFAAWLWFFYERYRINQKRVIPFIVACGLLLGTTHAVYYAFELKQYSAEFFFSGALFVLAQTTLLAEKRRLLLFVCVSAASLLFTYSGLIIVFVLGLYTWRTWWNNKTMLWALTAAVGTAGLFAFFIDLRFSLGGGAGLMQAYWADGFVGAGGLAEQWKKLATLYERFLLDWWKTEYGLMNENHAGGAAWYVIPLRVIQHPDVRNVLGVGALVVMVRSLWKGRDVLVPVSVLVLLMAILAWGGKYPWGQNRLTLYAMPLCALLIVEVLLFIEYWIRKIRWGDEIRWIIWLPFLLLVLRNNLYVAGAFAASPFYGDLDYAMTFYEKKADCVIVGNKGSGVILRAYPRFPEGVSVFEEGEKEARGRPVAYLRIHYDPPMNPNGTPSALAKTHVLGKTLLNNESVKLGLIQLEPKK